MRVVVGEAWEQNIAEDNWSFVTTSKCQPTKKKLSFLETNISKQKATYSYQVSYQVSSV